MRKHVKYRAQIAILLFLLAGCLSAQSAEDSVIELKGQMQEEQSTEAVQTKKRPGDFQLSVGSQYTFSKNHGSAAGLYAAPSYTLPLSNRLALHSGLVASSFRGLDPGQSEAYFQGSTYASLSMYVAASYRMNERLTVHGAGVKQLLETPVPDGFSGLSDQLSLGATFKLSENISIGAAIQIRNGNGYYPGAFGGTGYPGSFGSTAFSSPLFPQTNAW